MIVILMLILQYLDTIVMFVGWSHWKLSVWFGFVLFYQGSKDQHREGRFFFPVSNFFHLYIFALFCTSLANVIQRSTRYCRCTIWTQVKTETLIIWSGPPFWKLWKLAAVHSLEQVLKLFAPSTTLNVCLSGSGFYEIEQD